MEYVVRSMSTTDFDWRTGERPVPFHVYLLPSLKRGGAYWTRSGYEAERFAGPHEADAEAKRSLTGEYDVVPVADHLVPAYWELRELVNFMEAV